VISQEITLTPEQINWGVYVQNHIDAFGSCLYPSWCIRAIFKTNFEALKRIYADNLWALHYDDVLDLSLITDASPGASKPNSIREVQRRLRKVHRDKCQGSS